MSGQCLEKDYHGRSLFCYSNSSINSSLPVDCAEYSVIELRELHFQCYAISVFDVGIAMATAFAIAKVVIASVTAYVKVTESFVRVTKKPPQELKRRCSWCSLQMQHWCLLDCKECADIFCLTSSMVMLFILMAISFPAAVGIGINAAIHGEKALRIVYYVTSALMPLLLTCGPAIVLIVELPTHLEQGEYVSFAAEQRPPNARNVESGSSAREGQQDSVHQSVSNGTSDERRATILENRHRQDVSVVAIHTQPRSNTAQSACNV